MVVHYCCLVVFIDCCYVEVGLMVAKLFPDGCFPSNFDVYNAVYLLCQLIYVFA